MLHTVTVSHGVLRSYVASESRSSGVTGFNTRILRAFGSAESLDITRECYERCERISSEYLLEFLRGDTRSHGDFYTSVTNGQSSESGGPSFVIVRVGVPHLEMVDFYGEISLPMCPVFHWYRISISRRIKSSLHTIAYVVQIKYTIWVFISFHITNHIFQMSTSQHHNLLFNFPRSYGFQCNRELQHNFISRLLLWVHWITFLHLLHFQYLPGWSCQ